MMLPQDTVPRSYGDTARPRWRLLKDVLWVMWTTLQTRSLTVGRLFILSKRVPPRSPGIFEFPFGRVRYTDALSLLTLYSEIFVRGLYQIDTLGSQPYIIDCGGNIGLSTIWFKLRYPDASITVFEADPFIADVLKYNVQALQLAKVEVISAAVGSSSGVVTFVQEGTLSGCVDGTSGITVPSVRLSDRIQEPVDLLKVDIEGSEFGVIKDLCTSGKIALVKKLVCEIHGRTDVQAEIGKLLISLADAGFRITLGETESAEHLPGASEPTPFIASRSAKFVILLYAWQP